LSTGNVWSCGTVCSGLCGSGPCQRHTTKYAQIKLKETTKKKLSFKIIHIAFIPTEQNSEHVNSGDVIRITLAVERFAAARRTGFGSDSTSKMILGSIEPVLKNYWVLLTWRWSSGVVKLIYIIHPVLRLKNMELYLRSPLHILVVLLWFGVYFASTVMFSMTVLSVYCSYYDHHENQYNHNL